MKTDLITTVAGALPAVFLLLSAFGVAIAPEVQQSVTTLSLAIVSYYIGKPLFIRK